MKRFLLLAILFFSFSVAGWADAKAYRIDPQKSEVKVHVGKSGVFKFAGHEHLVLAPELQGEIQVDKDHLASSSVKISFASKGLKVEEKGEGEGDAPKVQAAMDGAGVLDIAQFPEISFASESVTGKEGPSGTYELTLSGSLSLHGVQKAVTLPVKVVLGDGVLTATGHATLRQTDFKMTPVSVAGVVKVKDEVAIEFTIVAQPAP
jgi:polyisoprenoid-binding protein YceI